MTLRVPFIEIKGPSGLDLVRDLGRDFVGVQIVDRDGGEQDECTIRFRRRPPYRMPPPKDTEFTVRLGWSDADAILVGTFNFSRVSYTGTPDTGQEMALVCLAPLGVDDALRLVDSEHFDAETGHATYGDVFRTLADRAGLGASVDPKIAAIPLAGGYLLRWKQSAIGLATDLADELGGIVKPQAGFLTVRRRGSFETPSGRRLQTIPVPFDPSYEFAADIQPDYTTKTLSGAWFDAAKGRPGVVLKAIGAGNLRFALPHLGGSQAYEDAATGAAAQRLDAESAIATFLLPGNNEAVAGSPVAPKGFGPDIDGIAWEAETVTHNVIPDVGWVTQIDAKGPNNAS